MKIKKIVQNKLNSALEKIMILTKSNPDFSQTESRSTLLLALMS